MLVCNGKIFTGRIRDGFASALRVEDGRFSWVGEADGAPEAPPGEEVLDVAGATVLPGLLDVHTHPALLAALVDSVVLLPPAVTSVDELVDALRASPARHPGGGWIEGYGYDEARFPGRVGPTRTDLDRVSTTQPVLVRRCDAHTAVANSVALGLAGITRDTPDPDGARVGRSADGEPNGVLAEVAAVELVSRLLPVPDRATWVDRLARLSEHFLSRGIVGVADLVATWAPEPLASFRAAARRALLPRTGLYPLWAHLVEDPPVLTEADRTGHVFLAGVKVLVDGAFSSATAWTHDPYPGSGGHGIRSTSAEDLAAAAAWARANGVQLACHAMGDAAIDAVLDAFADEDGWLGDVPSVRIEHATLFTPERIARVRDARMRFAVVSHSIFLHAEYGAYEANLRPELLDVAYPIASFHRALPHTALSSDAPATAHAEADDVFLSVQAAVTRRAWNGADMGQHEAVTVGQALELYTDRAASCMRLPGLGRIAPGYEASFVVLDRDVFTVPLGHIAEVAVSQTWVAGRRAWPPDGQEYISPGA